MSDFGICHSLISFCWIDGPIAASWVSCRLLTNPYFTVNRCNAARFLGIAQNIGDLGKKTLS
jgi:hypothetical protein